MSITSRIGATGPAKLVFAKLTLHLIAATVLFNAGSAHRTEGNVVLVLVYPLLQVSCHSLLA